MNASAKVIRWQKKCFIRLVHSAYLSVPTRENPDFAQKYFTPQTQKKLQKPGNPVRIGFPKLKNGLSPLVVQSEKKKYYNVWKGILQRSNYARKLTSNCI